LFECHLNDKQYLQLRQKLDCSAKSRKNRPRLSYSANRGIMIV
jgi:hypothetical protein